MVVAIILIVSIASVLRAKYGVHRHERHGRHGRRERVSAEAEAEAAGLRDEVKQLKERIQVLERITVEKENSLERQIEELRDR
ncbi:MAG TPA: hypothetical protein VGX37_08145 [Allosphingosinicella sp.]|nr:hypothetical protein [Allosphingosinicella sp.]